MPTLREIRSHMASVQSIAKVTRALEVVAAAKHQRLQARAAAAAAFAARSWELLGHLAAAEEGAVRSQLAFTGRPVPTSLALVLITSQRGMAGAYDANVIGAAFEFLRTRGLPAQLVTIGAMGREAALRRGLAIHADYSQLDDHAEMRALTPVARRLLEGYEAGTFDEVHVAYTQHARGALLRPAVRPLLPVIPPQPARARQYLFEPGPQELLSALLPRILRFQLYQVFLESAAAENAARTVAMRQAAGNARDLMDNLRLSYNKARQQAITAELLDLLGGRLTLKEES